MTERWRQELAKLGRAEPPERMWARVARGPRFQAEKIRSFPRSLTVLVAFALFVPAGILAFHALSPGSPEDGASQGSMGQAPSIFFPTQADPPQIYMTALLTGEPLLVRQGCMFVGPHRETLVIWPYGSTLESDSQGHVVVRAQSGAVMAQDGHDVRFGGGFVSEDPESTRVPEQIIGQPIPARCHPTYGYWLASPPEVP
jgi:hypothetical protein